MVTYL